MMKAQEVILKAMAWSLRWWEAAEIIGVTDGTLRRWRERYQEVGYDGLCDRGNGGRIPKRVTLKTAETVLQLYREKYLDFNVRHFHEKLVEEHGIQISYTLVRRHCKEPGWWASSGGEQSIGSDARSGRCGNVAAHRCQQARLVWGRASLRSDHDSGRRHHGIY
jgi:transposase